MQLLTMNSGSESEWPAPTVQYRLNLPRALHSISPAVSALHISRVASLHPEISTVLHPTHCPKCGSYRFSGDHPSSLVGPSTKKKWRRTTSSKALQRRCRLCGFSIDARTSPSLDHSPLPNDSSGTGTVPIAPRAKESGQDTPPDEVSRPTAETVQRSHPKPSHTKTSTLKDMLSRDRQREEAVKSQKKSKEAREGLAAFLREL